MTISQAIILAAGLGTRMQPLTKHQPKALVPVNGKPLIDYALARLADEGVEHIVVNAWYQKDKLIEHLRQYTRVTIYISEEEELLETGGGIRHALPLLKDAPFYSINSDSLWLNGATSALQRLSHLWDDARMDGLLMLYRTVHVHNYYEKGDFIMARDGKLRRRGFHDIAPHVYTGVQVLSPRLFAHAPTGAFSLNTLYDQALADERLYGMAHDGLWYHVSTPADVSATELDLRLL